MQDLIETAELVAFTFTVKTRSLTAAAKALAIPRATLGRRLARLEERLGLRLLRRTTRSVTVTDAGQAFYQRACLVLETLSDATASLGRDDGSLHGEVRVSVPATMPAGFHELVCRFAAQHPDVRLHVHFSNERIDLVRDGYDVAIRAAGELEPGLVARLVGRDPRIAVASPDYLAAHGTPRTRADLKKHRCLMGFGQGVEPQTHWPIAKGLKGQVHVEGALFSNAAPLLLRAALSGLGIAYLSRAQVEADVAKGRLVQVLAGVLQGEAHIAIIQPERELVAPQARAFVKALTAWAEREAENTPALARRR